MLTIGVFGTSSKKNEKRVPIHPQQLDWIEEEVRKNLFFEKGYGRRFGIADEVFKEKTGGILEREELFEQCDIALLPKPVQKDFNDMKVNGILWGWPHCVQQAAFTQTAIDRKLTLIAWEAMHRWGSKGDWQMHVFHKNNEIAGYAGVLHALNLRGIDGNYGPSRKCAVISFGSVSRGAIFALRARGFNDITVYTKRYATLVADQILGIDYRQYDEDDDGHLMAIHPDGSTIPFSQELASAEIIVNGVLQDTDHPLMFVEEDQVEQLQPGTLIIDISCDEGLGFPFARPTTFEEPMLEIGQLHYYAIDHTPSLLWDSATWEISNSLIPYLPVIMEGPDRWEKSETVVRAIEIRDGVIQNPKILSFQNRKPEYPHEVM